MKIQLDTTNKIIRLEESINLDLFIESIKKLLPNNEWKSFTIETNTEIQWNQYPVYIYPTWPPHPTYPTYPWITCTSADGSYTLNAGTYNVQVNSAF